jgi:hypothetical protein
MREVIMSRDWDLAKSGIDSGFADSYASLFNLLLQFKSFSSALEYKYQFSNKSLS